MIALLACAALTCLCVLVLGQAVMRLCGAPEFSWLAAPVGLTAIMLLAIPAIHTPGRTTTIAVIVALLTLAGLWWMLTSPAHRPPLGGLLAGAGLLLVGLVPFLANGRVGTLGWGMNNDMATHLLLADGYRSSVVAGVGGLDHAYPIGLHAWVAVLGTGTGAATDRAFAGVTLALPVLLGWTGLAAVRRIRSWGPFALVLLVGLPFLVAGYYGQGSFKELGQAVLILGCALVLAFPPSLRRRLEWVPFALMVAGTLSIYSYAGIVWPAGFLGLWVLGRLVGYVRASRSARPGRRELLAELGSMAIGLGVLLVVIIPQLPKLKAFYDSGVGTNGTGIETTSLGNLAGPVPFWESLGVWSNADYRIPGPDPLATGVFAGLVLALVVFGVAWSLRRREWFLPAATGLTLLLWLYADHAQAPYVAAKGLVLLTPMLMLVAVRPLVERYDEEVRWPMPSWWVSAAPVLALGLVLKLGLATSHALRFSPVGPNEHTHQIQSFRGLFGNQPVLFLGNDDFIRWELGGVHVRTPVIGFQTLPLRPQKPWVYGKGYDFDSIPNDLVNEFDWVVAPRDASASTPPPGLEVVRRTRDFVVYRRTARIAPYKILAEGDAAAVKLNCATKTGRAVLRGGGVAAVRPPVVTAPLATPIVPGTTAAVELPLRSGSWDLVAGYGGPRPILVRGPGLRTTLPPNLDRPGPRWPIGRITTSGDRPVRLTFHPTKNRLTWWSGLTYMTSVIAVPVGAEKIVPVAQACGKLVDWYRPASG